MSAVDHKTVVLAFLASAGGLTGLVLVFLGLVVSAYSGLAGDTPEQAKAPLRITARFLLAPFGLGIACMLAASVWLIQLRDVGWLYVATVSTFLAQLGALIGAALWSLRELLWG